MATKSGSGSGRPQLYPLNGNQVNAIKKRIGKGQSVRAIAETLEVHPFAVLRVRRSLA